MNTSTLSKTLRRKCHATFTLHTMASPIRQTYPTAENRTVQRLNACMQHCSKVCRRCAKHQGGNCPLGLRPEGKFPGLRGRYNSNAGRILWLRAAQVSPGRCWSSSHSPYSLVVRKGSKVGFRHDI